MKFILLAATVLALMGFLIPSRAILAGKPPALFVLTTSPQRSPPEQRISIASVREATITLDPAVAASLDSADRIEFPLFDGEVFTAERRHAEKLSNGAISWNGKIVADAFDGDVILTINEGFAAGLIYSPDGVYEITPHNDKHLLMEIDQSALPECGGEIAFDAPPEAREPAAGVDSGDRIDVLVMYTTATRNALGGDAQARTHAQNAVNASNVAYLNSRIRQRLYLVQAVEYAYQESPTTHEDLANLRADAEVRSLRDTYKADLVAMIGEVQSVCGVSMLMGPVGGNPDNGYSVTGRSCAVATLSFAHELGHNMGSHHNPENGSGATYPYGYGHYVNGAFRTVMSYSDPCTVPCDRRAYFSNPAIFRGPYPTGIENQRDNVRSINQTADTIANYRYSGSSITLSNFAGGASLPRNIARSVQWTSDNAGSHVRIDISRDEGTSWRTLIDSTENNGSEDIMVYGRPTRRARLRVVSVDDTDVSDSSVGNISIK